jgi:hypothetical protein
MTRPAAVLVAAFLAPPALAQSVGLAETVAAGDLARCSVELDLKGNLIVADGGRKEHLRLEAKARHVFAERTLAVADGLPASTARHYLDAVASVVVAVDKVDRRLPADRRLVIARRTPGGLFCFAPAGPLTRDELDLVTEHFNPQCLPGLLPNKEVKVGDTWPVGDAAAAAACLFDAVIKTNLTGKLTAVKDGVATFAIEGTAEGLESGAKVGVTVSATGTFDAAVGGITALTWKQTDDREQGPVNPASKVEATVTLKREGLAEPPKELADAALAAVPVAGEVPPRLGDLRYADPKGRYTITYPRDWYVTGQTDTHLVLRLLDRGEFAAQATVTAWAKAEAGRHTPAEEFRKAAAAAPGWEPGKVLAEGELPAGAGRWLYRVAVEGTMDGAAVVQTFYLLAGPAGEQVAVTVVTTPEKAKAVGTRDADLVKAIEPGKR